MISIKSIGISALNYKKRPLDGVSEFLIVPFIRSPEIEQQISNTTVHVADNMQ